MDLLSKKHGQNPSLSDLIRRKKVKIHPSFLRKYQFCPMTLGLVERWVVGKTTLFPNIIVIRLFTATTAIDPKAMPSVTSQSHLRHEKMMAPKLKVELISPPVKGNWCNPPFFLHVFMFHIQAWLQLLCFAAPGLKKTSANTVWHLFWPIAAVPPEQSPLKQDTFCSW